jgi:transposase
MWRPRRCSSIGPAIQLPWSTQSPAKSTRASIFVAALGASNFNYAEARWTETLPDWIGADVNALASIGGVSKALVPDNLKAGVTKQSCYQPGANRTYQDLADHLAARIVRPRYKARVEVAVQNIERFVLATLRDQRFFSLADCPPSTGTRPSPIRPSPTPSWTNWCTTRTA